MPHDSTTVAPYTVCRRCDAIASRGAGDIANKPCRALDTSELADRERATRRDRLLDGKHYTTGKPLPPG